MQTTLPVLLSSFPVHMPQEMRRTAPEERAAKRQRTEDGFQELSRFDYAAIPHACPELPGLPAHLWLQKVSKATRHPCVWCQYQVYMHDAKEADGCCCREKSCTREGISALEHVIKSLLDAKGNDYAPKFSIVKLACCGVVLLRWERAASSPRPTQVATELVTSVQQGRRRRLKCVM